MGAKLHFELTRRVVVLGAAIGVLGIFASLSRGESNPTSPNDWLYGASASEIPPAGYSSPVMEAANGPPVFLPANGPPVFEPANESSVCEAERRCGCNMCPCTYGVVEALILQRNIAGGSTPLVLDAANGTTLLTMNDLRFPVAGGLRAYFGHRFRDSWAWELGYFGLYNATTSAGVAGNLSLPSDFAGLNVFFGADNVAVNYATNINGAEFNLVNCCCANDFCGCTSVWNSVEWLSGFRYLRIGDTMAIDAARADVGGIERGFYDMQAVNNLYGGQVGARLRRCWGLWSLEGTAKAGLFYNDATQSQTVVDFPNFLVRQTTSSSQNLAFLGELNCTLVRQITNYWYLRGGYNLIWIDGIALAPNQLDFSLTNTSGTTTNTGGTMFLHGANLGLEARW
jgi:hypothetical protein